MTPADGQDQYSTEVPLPRFNAMIAEALPRLKRRAVALTRSASQDANDLVHDTVALMLKARTSYEDGSKFDAWAFTVMRNKFIGGLRSRRETTTLDDVPETRFSAPPSQERVVEIGEIARAINDLPPQMRESFDAVVMQDRPTAEVAEELAVPDGTVKSRVFRARQFLQERPTARQGAAQDSVSRHDFDRLRDQVAILDAELARVRKLLTARLTAPAQPSPPKPPRPPAAPAPRPPQKAPASSRFMPGRGTGVLAWEGGSVKTPLCLAVLGQTLLFRAGQTIESADLIAAVSRPGRPPISLASLQVYVSMVRKTLQHGGAPFRIVARPGGYAAVSA